MMKLPKSYKELYKMNNVTVICNVEHLIEVGVCALCQRDEYAKRALKSFPDDFDCGFKHAMDVAGHAMELELASYSPNPDQQECPVCGAIRTRYKMHPKPYADTDKGLLAQIDEQRAEIERLRKALQNLVHHVNLTWPEDCSPLSDAVDAAVTVLGKP